MPRKGTAKAKAAETPIATPTPPMRPLQTPKTAAVQPHELSARDRDKLKDFLNKSDKPFTVTHVPNSKKRKRDAVVFQDGLFDQRLDVQYEVKPGNNWESMKRYKKFTVGSESIATGECILVKHDESDDPRMNIDTQWKAKVLEVRALDPEHVYVRVAWLNRPEDLPSGRKAWHGKNELVPTNQMDIIDAMAVNGRLDVKAWEEDDDNFAIKDDFFWRQTYDFVNTKTFSALESICIDNEPANPDELILQCANKKCRKWLHTKCIAEEAVQIAAQDASATKRKAGRKKSKQDMAAMADPRAIAIAEEGPFTAEVFIKGLPEDLKAASAAVTEIVVTNAGKERHQDVLCLFCQAKIE